jgi:mRNA interferase MazF
VIFDRFETAVVPFPFAEVPTLKRRPVVILSGRAFNEANGATLVGMITTAKETSWPSDMSIRELGLAGLTVACLIRMRLTTIPNDLILRRLGKLGAFDRLTCERNLAEMVVG